MLYTEVLSKHSLTEDKVSQRLKAKIKQYKKIQSAVEEARTNDLPNAKTDKKKTEIENDISLAEENLVKLNQDISGHIEMFVSQKDANARRIEALKQNRKAIGKNKKPEEGQAAAPVVEEVVDDNTQQQQAPAQQQPAAQTVITEPKKKSNALAWIGGLVVAGIAIALGVKAYNKSE